MESRLTLKLDEGVIQRAKHYAQEHNRSVSKLVEDYFRNLTLAKEESPTYSPLVEELSGIIKEEDLDQQDYASYLEAKYE